MTKQIKSYFQNHRPRRSFSPVDDVAIKIKYELQSIINTAHADFCPKFPMGFDGNGGIVHWIDNLDDWGGPFTFSLLSRDM